MLIFFVWLFILKPIHKAAQLYPHFNKPYLNLTQFPYGLNFPSNSVNRHHRAQDKLDQSKVQPASFHTWNNIAHGSMGQTSYYLGDNGGAPFRLAPVNEIDTIYTANIEKHN